MCLIALALAQHPHYRLALIANRDELHARPSAPAGPDPEYPGVHGGRDLVQGGSWLMVSRRGRLAAVTNVRVRPLDAAHPRSRGALVRGFATAGTDIDEWLGGIALTAGEYGPFNLLLWDGLALEFASNYPRFERQPVTPGLHAVSNGAFDAPWPKSNLASRALAGWLENGLPADARDADVAPLLDALADRTPAAIWENAQGVWRGHDITGPNLVRRSALERVGGLDPELWTGVHDLDLCQRLRAARFELRIVQDCFGDPERCFGGLEEDQGVPLSSTDESTPVSS